MSLSGDFNAPPQSGSTSVFHRNRHLRADRHEKTDRQRETDTKEEWKAVGPNELTATVERTDPLSIV